MRHLNSLTTTARVVLIGILVSVWNTSILGQTDAEDTLPSHDDQRNARELGFQEALESIFPMSPDMIDAFLKAYRLNEKTILDRIEPNPLIEHQLIDLSSGFTPELIRVSPGIATAMGFYDATGTPWPVRQLVVGNSDAFEVIQLGDNANTLTISPLVRVGWTNLVIALVDEPNPIVLKVMIGEQEAHYRINFQVMQHGPHGDSQSIGSSTPLPESGDQDLLSALTGTFAPTEVETVSLSGVDAEAWIRNDALLVRSRYPLLSPSWLASLSGPGGMKSYRLPVHSVLLFAVGEQIVKAELQFEESQP